MKKTITCLSSIGVIFCALLFGGYVFCSRIISHSLVNVVIQQAQLEDKIAETLDPLHLPNEEQVTAEILRVLQEQLNDERVLQEVNLYVEDILSDTVTDAKSERTSRINTALKEQIREQAPKLQQLSQNLLEEEQIISILETTVDIVDVQGMYDTVLGVMKEEFTPQQKLMLQVLNFLKHDICHYVSQIGMVLFSILIVIGNKRKVNGLHHLVIAWLISSGLIFVLSQTIPAVLIHTFANTEMAAAIQDNISQLERLSIIYFGIFIVLGVLSLLAHAIDRHTGNQEEASQAS